LSISHFSFFTKVPTGTFNIVLSPFAPYWSFVLPFSPLFALNIFLYLYGKSVFSFSSAKKTIEPPFPPSPPFGPPKGTPDSLLPEARPSQPFPDFISIFTSS